MLAIHGYMDNFSKRALRSFPEGKLWSNLKVQQLRNGKPGIKVHMDYL